MNESRDKFITGIVLALCLGLVFMHVSFGGGSGPAEEMLSRQESEQMFQELGGEAGAKPVTMFVTSWCPVCRGLEDELRTRGIRYITADVEKNPDAGLYYQKILKGSTNAVPVTIVGPYVVLGYNTAAIVDSYAKL